MRNQNNNYVFCQRWGYKGFTLIELLVVIAIIGILAATVVLSLGGGTGNAGKSRTKLGVSSIRTLAFAEVTTKGSTLSGDALCKTIFGKVSGEKVGWEWSGTHQCVEGDLIANTGFTANGARSNTSADATAGEICCHAKGKDWVVWGALPEADGRSATSPAKTDPDIYCADSKGFLGELSLHTTTNLTTTTAKVACQS